VPPRKKAEEPPKDEQLEAVRRAARDAIASSSLRAVAKEIGVAHSTLREFTREDSPRDPYGVGRRRLLAWGEARGVVPRRRVSEQGPGWAVSPAPRIPPRAYQLVFEYCKLLDEAGVPEEQVEEARRLMGGETFNTLRKHMNDERTEDGWVKDVKAAWAFIKDTLRAQGFDL
jgi:hypothetical protein